MGKYSQLSDLQTEVNRNVLTYLADKSAHSDIGELLLKAVAPLGDAQLFCPDWNQCRYVTASTQGLIFAFAVGMNTMAFRLDPVMHERALATGGIPRPECGPDLAAFTAFRPDWPAVDFPFWTLKAYAQARRVAGA